MPKTKFPAVVSTFLLCFVFWLLLTWSFETQELVAGAIVSLAAALFSARFFIHDKAFWLFNPAKFGALFCYVFVFLGELIKANVDVAKRCFGGCTNVNPGIVKVPVDLGPDYAQAMLANSITLTPGTITVLLENNVLCVHCLDKSMAEGLEDSVFVRRLRRIEQCGRGAKE